MHMVRYLFLIWLFTASASACSVPVFRYALEHWPADPFQVTVFHRGTLSDEQKRLVHEDALANARVQTINLDDAPAPEMLDLWRQQKTDALPWLVVRFPRFTGITASVISGPLTEMAPGLFDSPVRRQIIQQLAEGQSAVWVLLESGDRAKDDAAAALVETRLKYLMSVMTLPKLDAQDIANGLVSIAEEDLRLEFAVLRLSRRDPAERVLVQMLRKSESDLESVMEPMVFPIFGRGRALYALVGAGIRQETIDEAAGFLVGKCSCQVKEQNPGVDLLLKADWNHLIKTSPEVARDLPTVAELNKFAPVSVTTASQPTGMPAGVATPAKKTSVLILVLLYAVSPLISALAVIIAWNRWKRRRL